MSRSDLLAALSARVVVGDGAMRTALYGKGVPFSACFEELNAARPDLVQEVHRGYVEAGAELLGTNTFQANRYRLAAHHLEGRSRELSRLGARWARECARPGLFVAGVVGPLTDPGRASRPGRQERRIAFAEQIDGLLEGGCDAILFASFSDLEELLLGVEVAKLRGAVVIAQLAFWDRDRTAAGVDARAALRALEGAGADVVGANCGQGPRGLLRVVEMLGRYARVPLSVFPNAGYPDFVDGRYTYRSSPAYLASMAERLVSAGACLVGGCCGTGPEEIRALADRLKGVRPVARASVEPAEAPDVAARVESDGGSRTRLARALGRRPLVVAEIDPPKGLRIEPRIDRARRLVAAGADAITVGDSPLAIPRMGNAIFASHVMSAVKTDVILHVACRDRNRIGLEAELMAAASIGVAAVLCLTGDPAGIGAQAGATSVFDLDSVGLIRIAAGMRAGIGALGAPLDRPADFAIGVSFNPNARYLDDQIRRLEKKIEAGAQFAMTQPVFSAKGVERLADAVRALRIPVLCGVMPLTSAQDAEYLHGEVPGIAIPDHVRERMRRVPEERSGAEGIALARELVEAAVANGMGVYLVAPFGAAGGIETLVRRASDLSRSAAPVPTGDDRDPEREVQIEE